jgi:hypothetical protein
MSPASITILRVTGKPGDTADGGRFGGAAFDRLVEVPPELVRA